MTESPRPGDDGDSGRVGIEKAVGGGNEGAKTLPPSLVDALEGAGVDPSDPSVTKALAISLSIMTASAALPLPPPAVLTEYEKALPGLNAKLVEWTEKQALHRQGLEMLASRGAEDRMNRSQIFTAAIAISSLVLSAYEGQFGNPYVAGVIAIVGVGGPAAAIYLARSGRLAAMSSSRAERPTGSRGGQVGDPKAKPKR